MVSATFVQKNVLLATPVQPNVVSTGVASRRVSTKLPAILCSRNVLPAILARTKVLPDTLM